MAGFVGPEIPGVTDELAAYFDAALTYTSGSTSWDNDLGSTPFSLMNGPILGGTIKDYHITFDGTDDYAIITGDTTLPYNRNNFSIEVWCNFPNAHTGWRSGIVTRHTSGAGTSNEFFLGASKASGPSPFWFGVQSPQNSGGYRNNGQFKIESTTNYNTNTWYQVVGTFDGSAGTSRLYATGSLIGSNTTFNDTSVKDANKNWRIAGFDLGTSYSTNLKVAVVKIYNKTLTSQEVLQNYNALKSRFNL